MTKKVPVLMATEKEPMTFAKLKEVVKVIGDSIERQKLDPEEVVLGIRVQNVSAIGPSPITEVLSVSLGFDWDRGRCIIYPMKTLREIELDELANLRKQYNTDGMKQYEFGQFQKKYEVLLDKYEDLKFLARTHGVKVDED
jgi:hypothetical protein